MPLKTGAVPIVVLPTLKVTVPAMVPAVDEFSTADRVAVPPNITELGVAVTVMLVGSVATINMPFPAEAAKMAFPP